MRVLVIGANGFVGSAVARRLVAAGHLIHALARDDARAAALLDRGYTPVRAAFGEDALVSAVGGVDGVVNCASLPFNAEWPSIAPILKSLAGTQKPFIQTTGTAVLSIETPHGEWREETFAEDDLFEPPAWIAIRTATEQNVRQAALQGIRAMVVRPPMIWGHGGSAQIPAVVESVRAKGAACYIGQGLNLYSHVHVDDLAEVYRLALERGKPGALYHAVAGETCWRSIAEAVARAAGCSAKSVTIDEARLIWGDFRGPLFFGVSSRSRAPRTRSELGWAPVQLDVVQDAANGSYRDAARAAAPS